MQEIIFTYDVKWEASLLRWSNRWDVYLHGNPNDEIHYFSIINSFMIVLFLTGVVAMIMFRTLHKDIASYNEIQTLLIGLGLQLALCVCLLFWLLMGVIDCCCCFHFCFRLVCCQEIRGLLCCILYYFFQIEIKFISILVSLILIV